MFKICSKLLLILGFILSSSVISYAQLQELELVPITEPDMQVPVFRDYPDNAAIIITSSLTNLQFEANVEVVANLSEPNNGEYRLIVPPFRQSITATAPGYRQLRFTIPVSQAREVLFYEIRPLGQQEDLLPVIFNITPLTAIDDQLSVFVDGQAVNPRTSLRLTPGTHDVRIEKGGFETIIQQINVDENNFSFPFELVQVQLQQLIITTNQNQAQIIVRPENNPENIRRGTGGFGDFVFAGNYFVEITNPGFRTINTTVRVVNNPTNDASINNFSFDMESIAGTLNLTVAPPIAQVTLNGLQKNANAPIVEAPGLYQLEVRSLGYKPYSETIEIPENGFIDRNVTLEQITGGLLFRIQPIQAAVTLLNSSGQIVDQWTGLKQIQNLAVGQYRIQASATGFQNYTESFQIFEDQTYNADVQMVSVSDIERQAQEREEQLERDRANIAAAEEARANEAAERERRKNMIKHPTMSGWYFYYDSFTPEASSFDEFVTESVGAGIGLFLYNNFQNFSMEAAYNNFTLTSEDFIWSLDFTAAYTPTLSYGPLMAGVGLGFDYTYYTFVNDGPTSLGDFEEVLETADLFYNFQASLLPKEGKVGIQVDYRVSIDSGISDIYYPWTNLKVKLILRTD